MLELKRDIITPNSYMRAGVKKTKEEWEKLFPHCSVNLNDWFVSDSDEKINDNDLAWHIVDAIFEENGLTSIAYKQAAVKACIEYKNRK